MHNTNHTDFENRDLAIYNDRNLPSPEYRDAIPEPFEEEINLRDYLDVLVRRKWVIISILLLVFIYTFISTMTSPRLYKASATLEITPGENNITKFEDVTAASVKTWELKETQVSLLKTETLMKRVINKLNLMENPLIYGEPNAEPGILAQIKGEIKSIIKSAVHLVLKGEDSKKPQKSLITEDYLKEINLLKYLTEKMEVTLNKDSMLVTISFESPSRALCPEVINTLADEFLAWKMEKKLEASQVAQGFLMKQIERAKINLEKAEEDLNFFAKSAGIISLDSKMNTVYKQLEELNSALAASEAEMVIKKSILEQAKKEGLSNLPQVLESDVISNLKETQAALQSEYEDLAVTFKDGYPKVQMLKSRMDALENRIRIEENAIFQSIESRYLAALEKVNQLRKRVKRQEAFTVDLNERATQYKIMIREVDTNKAIYQSLLERSKEIESMVGVSPSNISIVDRASLPISPFKPNVKRNLMLGIVLGLFLGVGFAFLLEYFNDSITNPDQIFDRFRIPILGVIPLNKKNKDYPVGKTFMADPGAEMSEAIRTTRISLQLSGSDTYSQSFLVTSSLQGEGKSTITVNLGAAYAGVGRKVVLIDCDFRRPHLHKILKNGHKNQDGTRGLTSFLAGVIKKPTLYKSGIDNLYYIPSGPIPPNPVELLASARFSKLLKILSRYFDQIIVDSPPHNGLADVLVMCRHVDGVVLVSGVGETTRNSLRIFKNSMRNVQGKILGCIVNKVDLTRRYGYRSYSKYYCAYKYDYNEEKKRKRKKEILSLLREDRKGVKEKEKKI